MVLIENGFVREAVMSRVSLNTELGFEQTVVALYLEKLVSMGRRSGSDGIATDMTRKRQGNDPKRRIASP